MNEVKLAIVSGTAWVISLPLDSYLQRIALIISIIAGIASLIKSLRKKNG